MIVTRGLGLSPASSCGFGQELAGGMCGAFSAQTAFQQTLLGPAILACGAFGNPSSLCGTVDGGWNNLGLIPIWIGFSAIAWLGIGWFLLRRGPL